MATVNYDLNSSLDFPPLSKRYDKQHHKQRKSKRQHNHDNVEIRSRIDKLNDTLLELIFIRLFSWKYLIRSKAVSRRWNSVISNPVFIRTLTKENYPFTLLLRRKNYFNDWQDEYLVDRNHPDVRNHKLLLDFFPDNYFRVTDIVCQTYYADLQVEYLIVNEHPDVRNDKLNLDFFPDSFGIFDIVGQNNDVLVFRRALKKLQEVEYYIVNPLTKQYVVLVPKPAAETVIGFVHAVGISGFVDGVSSVTAATSSPQGTKRGFRMVEVIEQSDKTLVLRIYLSKTSQWTTYLYDNNYFESYMGHARCDHAITLNNKVHWLFKPFRILVIDPFNIDIVPPHTLDLSNEIGRVIDLDHSFVLDVCQNQLRIALLQENKADGDYKRIKVWEIEDYNEYDNLANNNNNNNYMAKLRLVIDVSLNRSIIERELPPIRRRLYPKSDWYYECYWDSSTSNKVICCHPNDPHVVYFVYNGVLYYYDDFKKICKVLSHYCTDHWSHRFVFMHPLTVQS